MADFKHLVRIADTDLDGKKAIVYALKEIRGVGVPLAHAVCEVLNMDGLAKIGNASDSDIKKIDEAVRNPTKHGIPTWMLNRRKDMESGADRHIITNELIFVKENDIKFLRRIKCYRGVRHSQGAPVRGQRTRSHFRKNKGKVMGVSSKAAPKKEEAAK